MSGNNFVPLVISMLFALSANAQKAMNLGEHMLIKISDKALYGDPAAEKEEGTPYLNENFVAGVVYDHKARYEGIPMRYNSYDDQIEFKQNNQLYILDPQPRIRKVELDGHTFVGKSSKVISCCLTAARLHCCQKKWLLTKNNNRQERWTLDRSPPNIQKHPTHFITK